MIPFLQEKSLLDKIRDGFGGAIGEEGRTIATVAGILVLVLVGVVLHALFSREGKSGRKARRAFRRLAQANGLSRDESDLLLRAARSGGLDDPALIFVQRSVFEGAAARLSTERHRVDALREKVYGA